MWAEVTATSAYSIAARSGTDSEWLHITVAEIFLSALSKNFVIVVLVVVKEAVRNVAAAVVVVKPALESPVTVDLLLNLD